MAFLSPPPCRTMVSSFETLTFLIQHQSRKKEVQAYDKKQRPKTKLASTYLFSTTNHFRLNFVKTQSTLFCDNLQKDQTVTPYTYRKPPRSSCEHLTSAPVKTARSSTLAFLLSPKPGALMAHTCTKSMSTNHYKCQKLKHIEYPLKSSGELHKTDKNFER